MFHENIKIRPSLGSQIIPAHIPESKNLLQYHASSLEQSFSLLSKNVPRNKCANSLNE